MSPRLVEEFLTAYYNPKTNPFNTVARQGKIKVRADFEAARQASDIRDVFEKYRSN